MKGDGNNCLLAKSMKCATVHARHMRKLNPPIRLSSMPSRNLLRISCIKDSKPKGRCTPAARESNTLNSWESSTPVDLLPHSAKMSMKSLTVHVRHMPKMISPICLSSVLSKSFLRISIRRPKAEEARNLRCARKQGVRLMGSNILTFSFTTIVFKMKFLFTTIVFKGRTS